MQAVSAVAISLTFSSGSTSARHFLLDPLRKLAAVQRPSAQRGDKESERRGLSRRINLRQSGLLFWFLLAKLAFSFLAQFWCR